MVSMDSIRTSGCNHHSADDCPLRFPFVFAATTAAGAAVVVDVFLLFFFHLLSLVFQQVGNDSISFFLYFSFYFSSS